MGCGAYVGLLLVFSHRECSHLAARRGVGGAASAAVRDGVRHVITYTNATRTIIIDIRIGISHIQLDSHTHHRTQRTCTGAPPRAAADRIAPAAARDTPCTTQRRALASRSRGRAPTERDAAIESSRFERERRETESGRVDIYRALGRRGRRLVAPGPRAWISHVNTNTQLTTSTAPATAHARAERVEGPRTYTA